MIIEIHEDGTTKNVDVMMQNTQCAYYDTEENVIYYNIHCMWGIDKFIDYSNPPSPDDNPHRWVLQWQVDRNKWGDTIANIFEKRPSIGASYWDESK